MHLDQKIIAVMGATGNQGSGVVNALLARGKFGVRVITRNPHSEKAQAFKIRDCEVVQGDLTKPETLPPTFASAYGAFVVTNFGDPGTGESEMAQGTWRAPLKPLRSLCYRLGELDMPPLLDQVSGRRSPKTYY